MERKQVEKIFDHHFKSLDPYRSAQLIVHHVDKFKDKYYYFHRYVCFLIFQLVSVCLVFGIICNIMDVRVNGMSFDVINWLQKEHEDRQDFLSSKFPETVLCFLDSYSSIGKNINSEYIQCHIGINILFQSLHICALWLHLGLLFVVIIDFIWHIYMFVSRKHTPVLRYMPISKHFFCLLLEKNIPYLTWNEVLALLSTKDDVESGIITQAGYNATAPKKS